MQKGEHWGQEERSKIADVLVAEYAKTYQYPFADYPKETGPYLTNKLKVETVSTPNKRGITAGGCSFFKEKDFYNRVSLNIYHSDTLDEVVKSVGGLTDKEASDLAMENEQKQMFNYLYPKVTNLFVNNENETDKNMIVLSAYFRVFIQNLADITTKEDKIGSLIRMPFFGVAICSFETLTFLFQEAEKLNLNPDQLFKDSVKEVLDKTKK